MMIRYHVQHEDGYTLPVTGIPIAGTPLAVRHAGRGDWTVDHVPSGFGAKPGRVLLPNRRAALAFARSLATVPLPWDARTKPEFQAGLSRLSSANWDRFRDICDAHDRSSRRLFARLLVRTCRFRGRDGFRVAGRDAAGKGVSIFVESRGAAERIRALVRAGGEYGQAVGDVLLGRA